MFPRHWIGWRRNPLLDEWVMRNYKSWSSGDIRTSKTAFIYHHFRARDSFQLLAVLGASLTIWWGRSWLLNLTVASGNENQGAVFLTCHRVARRRGIIYRSVIRVIDVFVVHAAKIYVSPKFTVIGLFQRFIAPITSPWIPVFASISHQKFKWMSLDLNLSVKTNSWNSTKEFVVSAAKSIPSRSSNCLCAGTTLTDIVRINITLKWHFNGAVVLTRFFVWLGDKMARKVRVKCRPMRGEDLPIFFRPKIREGERFAFLHHWPLLIKVPSLIFARLDLPRLPHQFFFPSSSFYFLWCGW